MLDVQRVAGALIVASTTCVDASVPAAHNSAGIADADFAIYVTSSDDGANGNLGYAGFCETDQHFRPTAAQLHYNEHRGTVSMSAASTRPQHAPA